ncbi:uncharacterized protein LOC126673121 [Mercurialis annua]|uniref:uncharacterized protein LOC126673121 n=1 Tax=Mercurialis annua TaxID=3986 RepID=UPI00215DD642|nr:uncharacterized protein LOC126673121 [Mercurialis annua]
MLSLQLKDLVVSSSSPVTNYWNNHQFSTIYSPSLFLTNHYARTNNATQTLSTKLNTNSKTAVAASSDSVQEEEEYEVITAMRSNHNDIVIVDTPKARMLLLDSTHNVHSILNKDQKWTGAYWDEFASLPAIIPEGPVAILGLGAGTAAHLMLHLWPSLDLHGWEIDPILIDKARQYFGLSDLEIPTTDGGILRVHVDDALSPAENDSGKFAGIIIDLFSEGRVLLQLHEVATWLDLSKRLMPNGRFMVNCGGISEKPDNADGTWMENPTVKALSEAFPGQVNWKRVPETEGSNFLAFTGPLPDFTFWASKLPHPLSENVKRWKPCS